MKIKHTEINGKKVGYYDVSNLSYDEWVAFRSSLGKLGGSDVGTVCGVNKFKDGLTLFLEKIGLKEDSFNGNVYTFMGSEMESMILDWFCYGDDFDEVMTNKRNNIKIREAHDPYCTYVSEHMPWFAANLDGLITRDDRRGYLGTLVAECKKISGRASDAYVGGIPPSYIYQLQSYMYCLGSLAGYITAYVGEKDFIVRYYEVDETIMTTILNKCSRFDQAVKEGKRVMANKKLKQNEKLEQLYIIEDTFSDVICTQDWEELDKWLNEPINIDRRKDIITATPDMEEMVYRYDELAQKEAAAKLAKKEMGGQLKQMMTRREAKGIDGNGFRVRYNKRLSVKIEK